MARHMSKEGVEFVHIRMLQSNRAAELRELDALSSRDLKRKDKELTEQMNRMEDELKELWERLAAVRVRRLKKTKGDKKQRYSFLGTLEHMIEGVR